MCATAWLKLERAEDRDPLLETELETQKNEDGQHVSYPALRRSLSTLLMDEKRGDKERARHARAKLTSILRVFHG